MLLLRAKTATIDNITFFADDSDENQFWYMPGDIHLAEREGNPIFTLIKYTGDGADQQGGYINFEVDTSIPESDLKSAFRAYLSKLKVTPPNPLLQQVPYDNGTVNFFVLDAQNANGKLVSAQSPSLFAKNSAIFSAKLTPEQAVILEAAFSEMQAPAAVAYNLTYTGITPALKVEVEGKFENIYQEFDTKFGANIPIPIETPASFWLGFDSVMQKLQQEQKLIIKVTESMPGEEAAKEKEWALEFVKGEILKSFFTASLKPNEDKNTQAKSASDSILDALFASGKSEDGKEGKGGLLPCASLEIKLVRREETKTLNFTYTSSKAITQSAVPQNFIGSKLLRVKKEKPYFREVNVNDPFFQKIKLEVLGPDGFNQYGLKAATVAVKYNNNIYTPDAFTSDNGKWEKEIARSKNTQELFQIDSEFAFKSAAVSGWEGSTSYHPASRSASTMVNLDPTEVLTFNQIRIKPDKKFPWDDYNEVVVELRYQDDEQTIKSKKFTFSEDEPQMQIFKYRCLTEKPWTINYTITYYLLNGKTRLFKGEENPPAIIISPFKEENA
ncbi:hypothetical protein GA0061071_10968 [Kosakonia oryzendophytica]|uniref:Thiol-activated cytolysin n=1 Tax=Kosakonia oryzendophytica TaxID=1005665 RepID=A0A1C4CWW7_9ENTR|nr:hypothetical protein [Kosakonia oryzendophytica]SCC23586.1 hypothetical protein GA0061071_10968 [Kosakonia oryzendophytica]